MEWNKLNTVLAIIISLGVIGAAMYRFDFCKVEREAFATYQAKTDVQFLEIQRRNIVQRMWDIEKQYPETYRQNDEWKRLKLDLEALDRKIDALYKKGS